MSGSMSDQGGYLTINDLPTWVYDSGARPGRPTVVMVHGGDVRSLSNGLDWSTVWQPDILDARLIAYDKPGQGRSYAPGMAASAATLSGIEAHLSELVAGLPGPVLLMGHSRGALPVAKLALECRERISGLVLVSSNTLAPPSAYTPKDFYARAYANPPDLLSNEYLRREPEMNSFSYRHIDDEFIKGRRTAAEQTGWWDDLDHRRQLYPEILELLNSGREEVLATLRSTGFAMPVIQIWGAADVSAPLPLSYQLYELMARHTSNVTSLVFSRAAHYVYRERPAEFLSHVRGFLDTIAG